MKDQSKQHGAAPVEPTNVEQDAGTSVSRGRRSLIQGAAGALPMILTLQSGAALARSSNLIVTASPDTAVDEFGRTLCMDRRTVYTADDGDGEVYDLGEPAYARVGAINERDYYSYSTSEGVNTITEAEMCERGGAYYYRSGWGMGEVKVQQGMLVSATALSSFAAKIDIIDI